MIASCSIASAPLALAAGGNAAIAIVEVRGDVSQLLANIGVADVAPPLVRLRTIPDVDRLVIARSSHDAAWIFPHAGPVVLRRLLAALQRAGAELVQSTSASVKNFTHGPTRDHLVAALARAPSPLAIDLLLDQQRRWANAPVKPVSPAVSHALKRLIDPPLVVALGPPNIGKSSLLNALAGRVVAIVADEPGTTRDHVGALIDFAGLVVRYVDAPGIASAPLQAPDEPDAGPDAAIQAEAQQIALTAAAGADLLLICGDQSTGYSVSGPASLSASVPRLRVALRTDLGLHDGTHDVAVSVREHDDTQGASGGLALFVARVKETLVPPAAMADTGAWAYWV